MGRLFKRQVAITVGIGSGQALRVTGLDARFTVKKDLTREPNTAEISIFNLSETSRRAIESQERQRVRLEAGYEPGDGEGGLSVIFEGDLRKAGSQRDGPDIVTRIEAADAERALRRGRVNRSFGAGTALSSVIGQVADTLGIGRGNLNQVAGAIGFEGLGNVFSEGTVVSGPARRELAGLLESAGVEYSIQDGTLQLLARGRPLNATAVRLAPDTGLIESPTVDSEGVVSFKALLIAGIFPGRRVQIDSSFVRGIYRAEVVRYIGDTSGGEWFVEGEAKG